MKQFLKLPYIWLFLLVCIYILSRIIHLTSLPIFTDEAIYIRWAQIGGRDSSWRFISLTDGKQPLFTWLMMGSLRIFQDPLFAGRMVSVVSGCISLIGMYVLGHEVFKSKRIGILSSVIYLVSPFALFYDRLALYDSLVTTCSLWNLYLAVLLARKVRLDIALLLGIGLGLGMLNKTSAFLNLYFLPWTLILLDWKTDGRINRLMKWIGLALISTILSQVIYSILRLSPYFYIIAQKDTIFVYPFSVWITHPFQFFIGNIRGMFDWLVGYVTWPIYFLVFVSMGICWKNIREKLVLFGWWLFPFTGLALFGRVLYPRYILFMVMPLFILSAWSINILIRKVKNWWVGVILLFFILFPSMSMSYSILSDIKTARIPKSELGQYINDWPSGWGVSEIVEFLWNESIKGNVSVYTEGTFGLLPYAFEIYLGDIRTIDIHGIWPVPTEMPKEIAEKAAEHPTYFVMYQFQTPPSQWPLTFIASYDKGLNKNSTMRLYKVNP
jgi:4-amino-4-deoxy-L-arabinose transferase-like glycosyltransferase